jgi:hypothetical protein
MKICTLKTCIYPSLANINGVLTEPLNKLPKSPPPLLSKFNVNSRAIECATKDIRMGKIAAFKGTCIRVGNSSDTQSPLTVKNQAISDICLIGVLESLKKLSYSKFKIRSVSEIVLGLCGLSTVITTPPPLVLLVLENSFM